MRGPRRGRSLADAEQDGVKFFEFLGVSSLEEARKLDAEFIMGKALEYRGFWGTVVDNQFCVGNTFELFLQGKRLNVPVMMGHIVEFFARPMVESKEQLRQMAEEMFGEDAASS